jgi:replicative DNA helicase
VNDLSRYTVPPHRLEAEESVLASALLDKDACKELVDILSPEDFYKTAHNIIFSAIIELTKKETIADLVTIASHLIDTGRLEEVGGGSYIASLSDCYVPDSFESHAEIIKNKSILRKAIVVANNLMNSSFADDTEASEVVYSAQQALLNIESGISAGTTMSMSELTLRNIDRLEKIANNPKGVTGISSGYPGIDLFTCGFQNTDLIILAARPSMGKTALAINMATNIAKEGIPVGVFELEMTSDQLNMRVLSGESRVNSQRIRFGNLRRHDWDQLTSVAGYVSDLPVHIDDKMDMTISELRRRARRMVQKHGVKIFFIDYLQLMMGGSKTEKREQNVSAMSRGLKAMAKELCVPVVALSQLNRKCDERNNKRPVLSDLRESGALEQDADVVAFIYRDELYNKDDNNPNRGIAEIDIAKQRNGPVGVVKLVFLQEYTRFESLAEGIDP